MNEQDFSHQMKILGIEAFLEQNNAYLLQFGDFIDFAIDIDDDRYLQFTISTIPFYEGKSIIYACIVNIYTGSEGDILLPDEVKNKTSIINVIRKYGINDNRDNVEELIQQFSLLQ